MEGLHIHILTSTPLVWDLNLPGLNNQAARVGSLKKTGLKLRISGGRGTSGVEARLCGRRGTGRGKDRDGRSNSSVGDGATELGIVIHGGLAQACDPGATLIARNIERPGNGDDFA